VPKKNNREEICAEVVRLLVEERKRNKLSGNSLAENAGLSQSLISSLESNPWNPTLDSLLRIAEVLNVDLGEILSRARKAVLEK
jgi:transcriptional regulator with XRE-family HTH domain